MIDLFDTKNIIIGLAIGFFLYLLLKSGAKRDKEFEKEYAEILYSDKYKVKRQY